MKRFRIWLVIHLWRWHLLRGDRCPVCGLPLLDHGFEGHNQAWTCPKLDCVFNYYGKEKRNG